MALAEIKIDMLLNKTRSSLYFIINKATVDLVVGIGGTSTITSLDWHITLL